MPVGSDSLLDPALILEWLAADPTQTEIMHTHLYSMIHESGGKRIDCHVGSGGGGGMMLPASMVHQARNQLMEPTLQKGCDHATLRTLGQQSRVEMRPHDVHQWAIMAVRTGQQITSYDGVLRRWGTHEEYDHPLAPVREFYGERIGEQITALYS
jgi:hypothetical protein